MKDEDKKKIALFRYGVISDLVTGAHQYRSNNEFYQETAKKEFKNPDGKYVKLSADTIERWYYIYRRDGFDGLCPIDRLDLGSTRKLNDEEVIAIKHYVEKHPRLPSTEIRREMIKNGYMEKDRLSVSAFARYVKKIRENAPIITTQEKRRYEAENINQIWCCDTTYSFKLTVNDEKKRVYIIAIIDDASRYIVGIGCFFNDNYANFMSVLKSAVRKFGKPKILNLDNGAPYKNKQLELLGARVGIGLWHGAPYSGYMKAKIERWFKTMKDHFMAKYNLTSKTTIEQFEKDLKQYVNDYHNTVHSSIKQTPSTRFFKEYNLINRINDEEIDKLFLLEIDRKVSADGVILIDNVEYEVPYKFANRRIKLRYSPDLSDIYVVNPDETYEAIKLLNKHENARIKRQKPIFNTEAGQ